MLVVKRNFVNESNNNLFKSYLYKMSTDIIDNEFDITLLINLPGVSKEEINIDYSNKYLTISVNHKYNEYEYNFKRSYYLDSSLDTSNIDASLENGILKIILKKIEKVSKKIEIK